MKVGGNTAFIDYLTKNGRGQVSSSSTAKEKYTSKAADAYKEELKRRAKEDEMRYGSGPVVVEGAAEASTTVDSKAAAGNDDDFFDSWDKPTNIISNKPAAAPLPSPLPRVGLSPAITPNGSRAASPKPASPSVSTPTSPALGSSASSSTAAPVAKAPPAPRTVSSSSLRATGTSAAATRTSTGAMKLGGGSKGKLGGVKKGGPAINFEEAERKAKEEEARIAKLGYDRKQEEEAAAAAAAVNAANKSRAPQPSAAPRGEMVGNRNDDSVARMGMGFGRLGFGQVNGMSGQAAADAVVAAKRAAQRANYNEAGTSITPGSASQ